MRNNRRLGSVTNFVPAACPNVTHMLRKLVPILLFPFLTPITIAQTVGQPFRNDLEVLMPPTLTLPAGSGATSCAFNAGVHSPTNAGVLQYRISGAPSATLAVVFLTFCVPCGGANTINFGSTTPVICGGPNAGNCLAGPANANLCWALSLAPGCWVNVPTISAGAGFFHVRIPIPPSNAFPGTLWAQGLIVDPCSTGNWHMTPAIGIN